MSGATPIYYVACWTEDDGIYHCGHKHQSLVDAMKCVFPDGGTFVRACEGGVFRSLSDEQFVRFVLSLREMPWSSQRKNRQS